MTTFFYLYLFLFLALCGALSFFILIQESKSAGLGAAFGGGDPSSSVFGTSTADVLKKITAYLAVIFAISCVVLSLWSQGIGYAKAKRATSFEQVEN